MAAEETNPEQIIQQALSQPTSYEQDGEKITHRSVSDVIEAAKFLNRRRMTMKRAFSALGIARISTPGTDEI